MGDQTLVPSAITYEPKINSRTVQGVRTGAEARQEGGTSKAGENIVGESQGGGSCGQSVNEVSVLARRPVLVGVPAESSVDVSAHSFWKRASTAMFDILIINLDVVSYLRMTP